VEQEKARETLLELLPTDEGSAVTEKELLAQAPEGTSRSTLKRALAQLVAQGTVRKRERRRVCFHKGIRTTGRTQASHEAFQVSI